jgi:hypothetical protein
VRAPGRWRDDRSDCLDLVLIGSLTTKTLMIDFDGAGEHSARDTTLAGHPDHRYLLRM